MVNSYVYYTGDGSTNQFQIPFDYLSKEFVTVYLDGVLLEIETDYIFAGDRTINFLVIPPNASSIFIQRVTSKDRLVEFRDASILVANDLDVSALQAIHIAEEANDNIQNVIQADPTGNFDALGRRIVNVADPIDATDAANKGYTDGIITTVNDAVTITTDKAIEASGYASDALGYRNDAITQVSLAEIHADDAAQSAIDAELAASSIGVLSSQGELAVGQDTITLPWAYDPLLGNIAVFLNGIKQAGDTLTFVDTNTVTVGEAVTETTTWEVSSVTVAGESILTALRDQAEAARDAAELYKMPIGIAFPFTGDTAPAGFVAAQGQLLSRTAFPDLWAFAQTSGNLTADDASWTKGKYSPGDGSTTFRIPDLRDQFIRGASGSRPVGNGEEDAFQGHWHDAFYPEGAGTASSRYYSVAPVGSIQNTPTGAFSIDQVQNPITDGVNGEPRIANETRPVNVAYLWCIKAFDVISNPAILNAQAVVNELGRLDVDKLDAAEIVAPGDAPKYVCRAWVNFDGTTTPPTIRASGNVSSVVRNATGDYTIGFINAMVDGNYSVVVSGGNVDSENRGYISTVDTYTINSVAVGFRQFSPSAVVDIQTATVSIFR